ncbi:hypothetical protein APHNP_1299 [Anaplasma phagocytophilum str. ApNP]|uniref:Uncharacterized protein n=1 Tax=Anaplasma phagocytophilum str. ApNP TaxID=1359153 RepID=A0A0F3NHG6_ANAPH|nr:hypothetical protein APHNP_1299 [Anaplasma phagocytophilum str. ApNP]
MSYIAAYNMSFKAHQFRASIGSLYVKASIKKLFRAYEVQVLKLCEQ